MTANYTLFHGDTAVCQIKNAYVKEQRRSCLDTNSWWKYNFDIENKGQGRKSSWMFVTHHPMVTHSCARYDITISKDKITGRNSKPCQNPKRFDLEVKGYVILPKIMYATHPLMVIDPCAKIWCANVKANMSYGSDTNTCENPLILSLRSKVNVVLGSWMYATDRQTDRAIPIYLPDFRSRGVGGL